MIVCGVWWKCDPACSQQTCWTIRNRSQLSCYLISIAGEPFACWQSFPYTCHHYCVHFGRNVAIVVFAYSVLPHFPTEFIISRYYVYVNCAIFTGLTTMSVRRKKFSSCLTFLLFVLSSYGAACSSIVLNDSSEVPWSETPMIGIRSGSRNLPKTNMPKFVVHRALVAGSSIGLPLLGNPLRSYEMKLSRHLRRSMTLPDTSLSRNKRTVISNHQSRHNHGLSRLVAKIRRPASTLARRASYTDPCSERSAHWCLNGGICFVPKFVGVNEVEDRWCRYVPLL